MLVLVDEELYRAQDLNPVYQNPDRRGRAELRSATRDDQDGERYYIHRCSPVYQNPDRRGRAELRSATRDDQDGERSGF